MDWQRRLSKFSDRTPSVVKVRTELVEGSIAAARLNVVELEICSRKSASSRIARQVDSRRY